MAKIALNVADEWTDNTLDEIVEHLDTVYRKAYSEMTEERRKSFSAFLKSDKKKLQELNDGKITKEDYKMWRIGWLNSDVRIRTLIDDYAKKITETNEIASDYINNVTPEIFAYNHNFIAYEFEKNSGVAFTIVDKNTIKELATGQNHSEFKTLSVNKARDYSWNRKKIQQALTSGIVQGKSIPKIAKDFYQVMGSNKKSAVRNARTAVTSAQNGGRQRGFEQAHDNGIKFKKEWLSAHDGRVRDSHAHLDGIQVEYNEKFPNGLMYPADPQGAPAEVYNCRCTLIADVLGMRGKRTSNSVSSYKEWLKLKEKASSTQKSEQYNKLKEYFEVFNVKQKAVEKLDTVLTSDEIISKLAGGDETEGSCVSLAFSYMGNRKGLDVTDYRGGNSCKAFALSINTSKVANLTGMVTMNIEKPASEIKNTIKVLKDNLETGKEYILITGKHASVVRKRGEDVYEYLEMQSGYEKRNKWTNFDVYGSMSETLYERFGCAKRKRKYGNHTIRLVNIDDSNPNDEFVDVLSYLNTSTSKQQKGFKGYAK